MTTDDQRRRAREIARKFRSYHVANGHPDNQIADSMNGEHMHYIGALAEIEFCDDFRCLIDEQLHSGGDVCDTWLSIKGNRYPVDIKAICFTGPNPRMMVPCSTIKPLTIYVVALYRDDSITLLGWHWGMTLIKLNQRRTYSRRGISNYTCLIAETRPMEELKRHCDQGELCPIETW